MTGRESDGSDAPWTNTRRNFIPRHQSSDLIDHGRYPTTASLQARPLMTF